jgi:hypothetical protein
LAGIILCAANGHNPWVLGAGPAIPEGIPIKNLIQHDVRMPSVCLFRVYSQLTFEERRFKNISDALDHITTLQKVL